MNGKLLPAAGTLILLAGAYVSAQYARVVFQGSISSVQSTGTARPSDSVQQSTPVSLPKPRPELYYAAITNRPVFEPSRRPVYVSPEQVEPESQVVNIATADDGLSPFPAVELLGVIRSSDSRSALLSIDGGAALWIKEGEMVVGWQLNRVSNEQVEFVRDSEREIVDLYKR